MRSSLLAIAVLAARMFAQTGTATVTGVISDPNGTFIPTASVQVKNVATGAIYKAVSGPNGAYSIVSVPPGTYDLTIPSMGFMYAKFERKSVAVASGQTVKM